MPLLIYVSLMTGVILAEPYSKVIECSFVHSADTPDRELYFRVGDYYHPIEFKKRERAGIISLQRMATFEVYEVVANRADEGDGYRLLASAQVPAHYQKVLLLVVEPNQEEGAKHRLIVIDDSTKTFPGSAFLFVNLCRQILKVDFGGASEDIGPDKVAVMPSEIGEKGGFVPCIIYNDKGQKYYENRLYSQQTARKIVFIGPPKLEGNLPVVSFLQQLLPQKLPKKLP